MTIHYDFAIAPSKILCLHVFIKILVLDIDRAFSLYGIEGPIVWIVRMDCLIVSMVDCMGFIVRLTFITVVGP